MAKKIVVLLLPVLFAGVLSAQTADPQLLAEINKIKAIDNHSHPPKVVAAGEKDDDFDALPCDPLEPSDPTTISRPENPQYLAAWKALYGYPYDDRSPEHVRELLAAKQKVMQEQGDNFPNWVLDQLGIETELANRMALGRGLQPPRFRWVPFDDALMYPLKTSELASETPDRKFFFQRETMLLRRYMKDVDRETLPATLAGLPAKLLRPCLNCRRRTARWRLSLRRPIFARSTLARRADRGRCSRSMRTLLKAMFRSRADYTPPAELSVSLHCPRSRTAGTAGPHPYRRRLRHLFHAHGIEPGAAGIGAQ